MPGPRWTLQLVALAVAPAVVACGGPRQTPSPAAGERPPEAVERLAPAPGEPFVRILGTAQDGGLPHVACTGPHCERARRDPSFARRTAALAIVLPGVDRVLLVDAGPDLPEHLEALADVRRPRPGGVDRTPVDGVLLTHAHLGHLGGLSSFGYEAVATSDLPVRLTPALAAVLHSSYPWSLMVERRNIVLVESPAGEPFGLGDGVTVTPFAVPHRDEVGDTVGYRIAGPADPATGEPGRSVLYVPDTDGWDGWEPSLEERLGGIDVALLDGTFYSLDELPGRDVASIGHPRIADTVARLAPLVAGGDLAVLFFHLNHSNPAVDPASEAAAAVRAAGMAVAREGWEVGLASSSRRPAAGR